MLQFTRLATTAPAKFQVTSGMTTIERLALMVQKQATTPLNRWYTTMPKSNGNRVEYFDFHGKKLSERYLAMFRDPDVVSIKMAVVEPDFENYEWPAHLVNRSCALVILFFSKERCIGSRIVLVADNGRIEEIVDRGMGDDWKKNEPTIGSVSTLVGKYYRR